MARLKLPYRTDVPIRFIAPEDVLNDNALDNTNDGSTCSFKVFDPGKDEKLSAAEAMSQVELSVTNAAVFEEFDELVADLRAGGLAGVPGGDERPRAAAGDGGGRCRRQVGQCHDGIRFARFRGRGQRQRQGEARPHQHQQDD